MHPDELRRAVARALESLAALEQRCHKLEAALAERQAAVPPSDAEERLNALAAQLEELRRMRADSAHSVQAMGGRMAHIDADRAKILSTLEYLLKRVEFVRREVLFEFQHGPRENAGAALRAEGKIVNAEKLARQKGHARLNLGCGHIPLDQYLNTDRRELPGVDIVAEVDDLPFLVGEVQEIFSAHLLEHFPQEELKRKLLPYWFGLLRPGGCFAVVVPDAGAMISRAANEAYAFDEFRQVFFGAQDYSGDFHYNMFTVGSLRQILEQAGFVDVEVKAEGRRNGACYEMELAAKKPAEQSSGTAEPLLA